MPLHPGRHHREEGTTASTASTASTAFAAAFVTASAAASIYDCISDCISDCRGRGPVQQCFYETSVTIDSGGGERVGLEPGCDFLFASAGAATALQTRRGLGGHVYVAGVGLHDGGGLPESRARRTGQGKYQQGR